MWDLTAPTAPTNNYFSELRSACKHRDQDLHLRAKNCRKCSARHIDCLFVQGRIIPTDAFGCIAGTRFFSTNSVPNCVSEDGDSHFTHIPVKVAFTAANLLNQLITFTRRLRGGQVLLKTVCRPVYPATAENLTPTFSTGTGDSASTTHVAPWRFEPGWMATYDSPFAFCSGPNRITPSTIPTTSRSLLKPPRAHQTRQTSEEW